MTHYINKAYAVAAIEKRLHKYEKEYEELARYEIWITAKEIEHKIKGLKEALSILDTLEVKEVDLEEEIVRVSKNEYFDFTDWKSIARHFFELGLNARKEE